jgi:hypothetical protein
VKKRIEGFCGHVLSSMLGVPLTALSTGKFQPVSQLPAACCRLR